MKPKSKRKSTSTRRGKPSNKNRPVLIRTSNGASTSGSTLELDAFLLEAESEAASFSESSLAASLSGIEEDAFLLEDDVEVISPDGLNGGTEVISPSDRAIEDEGDAISPDGLAGSRAPARDLTPPNPTPAPTGTDAHPITDFEEEYSLG